MASNPAPVQVISDSTCSLPPDLPARVRDHVQIVRTSVEFAGESWVEGSFKLEDFYERIKRQRPRSSSPSPHEYLTAYGAAVPRGPVLAIFLSAALSATYAAGLTFTQEFPAEAITVYDSQFFSAALGYMVAEAAELALAGVDIKAIVARLDWRRAHTCLLFTLDTLEYLRRSGRVNFVQMGLATWLNLKPILTVEAGKLVPVGRVRGRRKSLDELIARAEAYARKSGGAVWVSAMHGNAPDEGQWLLEQLAQRLPVTRSFLSDVPASVALHGGPGVVGVVVTPASGP